jgi:hypothetical protein
MAEPERTNVHELKIFAECDKRGDGVAAVVCQGNGWRMREDVDPGEFDLAFSRLLAGLRRRLQLTEQQMQDLEARRYRLSKACPTGNRAAA